MAVANRNGYGVPRARRAARVGISWTYNAAIIPSDALAAALVRLELGAHDAWFAGPRLWCFESGIDHDDPGQLEWAVKREKMRFLAALHQTAFADRPPATALGTDGERAAARAITAGAALNEAFFDGRWSFINLGTLPLEAPELALDGASLAAVEPPDYAPDRPLPGPGFADSWRLSLQTRDERLERIHVFCRWAIGQLCRRYQQDSCVLLPAPCLDVQRLADNLRADGIRLGQGGALRVRLPPKQDAELELHFALRERANLRPHRSRTVLEGTATLDAEWTDGQPMRGSIEEIVRTVDRLEDIPLLDF